MSVYYSLFFCLFVFFNLESRCCFFVFIKMIIKGILWNMHKGLWHIKSVFLFVFLFFFSFSCKVCCQGQAARPGKAAVGSQWLRCRGRRSCDPPSCMITWLPPSCPMQRMTKRARRDNRENVRRIKVLWLSLFFGGSFSQYCWIFVAYLCVALFCYKRWLKKEEKENVVGWSLYSGWG